MGSNKINHPLSAHCIQLFGDVALPIIAHLKGWVVTAFVNIVYV